MVRTRFEQEEGEREAIFRLHRIHCLSWQKGGVAAVQATDERWRVARGNVSRRRKRIPVRNVRTVGARKGIIDKLSVFIILAPREAAERTEEEAVTGRREAYQGCQLA